MLSFKCCAAARFVAPVVRKFLTVRRELFEIKTDYLSVIPLAAEIGHWAGSAERCQFPFLTST